MRIAIACMLVLLSCAQSAKADVAFNIIKATPGSIEVGQTAVFNVNIFSVPVGTFNLLDTIGLTLNVPVNGGRFSAGTANILVNGAFSAFPTSTVAFTAGNNIAQVNVGAQIPVATITLNATGATPGNYVMSLTNPSAMFGGGVVPVTGLPTQLNYTIVAAAVPEPSSLLLVVGAVGMVGVRRYMKKRVA